ncbi:hypothetical protein M0805_008026 [Coniferiporia weirii]|nr:hypothetical protein M0805_008026 [Coniferiporia weirii]
MIMCTESGGPDVWTLTDTEFTIWSIEGRKKVAWLKSSRAIRLLRKRKKRLITFLGKKEAPNLYELIQYTGNIVPRLYLMITVGADYMFVPKAPVKEIMKDMMEMSRGVQHPTRGLFLRHYLSGQMKVVNLQASIAFELTNFIEMNKLWMRLGHQGTRATAKSARWSDANCVSSSVPTPSRSARSTVSTFWMDQRTILPSVLEQVVNCRDVFVQEYLMEVVIQVLTDGFHFYSLSPFLSATAQLQQLAAYASRETENENPEETKRQKEAAAGRLAKKVKARKPKAQTNSTGLASAAPVSEDAVWGSTIPTSADAEKSFADLSLSNGEAMLNGEKSPTEEKGKEEKAAPLKKFGGITENINLFEVFWHRVVELIKARPDFCCSDRLEYVDQILGFASEKIEEFSDSPDLHAIQTTNNLALLFIAPINS